MNVILFQKWKMAQRIKIVDVIACLNLMIVSVFEVDLPPVFFIIADDN